MGKPGVIRRFQERFRAFVGGEGGGVAIFFAVSALPILIGIGASIDYGRLNVSRNLLQQATDAAALAAMGSVTASGGAQVQSVAQRTFGSAFASANATSASVTASYDQSKPSVTVRTTAQAPTQIARYFGFPNLSLSAVSTASTVAGSAKIWPVCVLIVANTQKHTLLTANSAQVTFDNCMVQVDTIDWDAVEARNSSSIASSNGENCFVGQIHYGNVTPQKNPSCTFFADPYAGKPMPASASTCDFTNYVVSASTTLTPGTYCGNTNLSAGNITMSPGLYIVKDGNFSLNGSANVRASGVTFLLTGSGPNFYMNGNSSMTLTPTTSGDFAGFAFYLDNGSSYAACSRYTDGGQMLKSPSLDTGAVPAGKTLNQASQNGIANCINAIQDYATLNLSGVVYMANAAFLAAGYSTVTMNGSFVSAYLIADDNAKMSLTGALPNSSAIAAQMQKASENTSQSATLRLVR